MFPKVYHQKSKAYNMSKSFQDEWVFPSVIKEQLNASRFETLDTKTKFKSGRTKFITRFYSVNNNEIPDTARISMELISKRTGQPYVICSVNVISSN